jgi:hypothetical protein
VSSSCAGGREKLRKSRLTFGAAVILDLSVGFMPGATSPDCRNALISCISIVGNALIGHCQPCALSPSAHSGLSMKPFALVTAASLVTGLMACSPSAEKPADKAEKPAEKVDETGCPDDGPRLPGTGICQGRVANYFDPARLLRPAGDPPEGCSLQDQ